MNELVDTKTRLLDAATTLFAQKGYRGASVRDITARAEANLGGVTYHFGSKATLYEEALRYSLQPLVERITEAASTRGTPTERILAVATTHFSFLSDRPQLRQLFLQLLQGDVTFPERVAALARGMIGTVSQLVVEGQRDGSIRSGDPRLLTVSIMAQPIMLNVLRPMLRVGPQIDLDDPETRERALSNALRFIRAGLDPATEV